MGKPRTLNKKTKKLLKKKGIETPATKTEENYTIDDVLEKAQKNFDECNYEMAQRFCQRALEMDQDNVKALELAATLLLEVGDTENAKHCLGRAITVAPNTGHMKYFTLAQLFQGKESLEIYRPGIQLLELTIEAVKNEAAGVDTVKEMSRELSNAFCSVAELFMTDLCDEDDAETNCTECLEKAIRADESNPEALQTKARFLLIKEQFEDARAAIKASLDLWLPAYQAVLDNKQEIGENFDPVEVCPLLYTTRLGTVKLLLELEEWDTASQVLEGLLEEDDEIVDTWYLLGFLNFLRASNENEEDYKGNARYYLKKAQKVGIKNPNNDHDMDKHIDELLTELGPGETEEDDENEGGNWEDIESSDEEGEMN